MELDGLICSGLLRGESAQEAVKRYCGETETEDSGLTGRDSEHSVGRSLIRVLRLLLLPPATASIVQEWQETGVSCGRGCIGAGTVERARLQLANMNCPAASDENGRVQARGA